MPAMNATTSAYSTRSVPRPTPTSLASADRSSGRITAYTLTTANSTSATRLLACT